MENECESKREQTGYLNEWWLGGWREYTFPCRKHSLPIAQDYLFLFIHLHICVYIVWAISPPAPHPLLFPPPSSLPGEPLQPSSSILLKRRHKQ
jgi:hypothetical protein